MSERKGAAPPSIGAIGSALLLLLLALFKTSSFPSFYTSSAALGAALLTLTTTSALPTSVALRAIAHPCNTTAPLLSADRFAFGCQKSSTSDAASFFLAVFFHHMSSGPAVWVANPTRPVSRNASLLLSSSANLILSDPNTSPAWSLAFAPYSLPAKISLDASGNLVIHDSTSFSLWQSFLHPLDLLLPGQIMTPGMKLVARSHSPPSAIINYSVVMKPAGFTFFVNFSDSSSLPYSIFSLSSSSSSGHGDVVMDDCSGGVSSSGHSAELQFHYDATQLFLRSCVANVSMNRSITFGMAVDFLRLDPDGNMRGYKYDYGNATWSVVYDWFVSNSNIRYGICSLPNVCGPYGICTNLSREIECSCPHLSSTNSLDKQLFLPLNTSDFRQGCRLAQPLSCSAGEASSYFIKLQGADYFANDALIHDHITKSTEQECVASCAENCTCKAAFYRADIGACFLYEEVLSSIGLANSTKFFNSTQIVGKVTKKASYVSQILAGHDSSAPLAVQYTAQPNAAQVGNRSSTNVLINYVGFLKVNTNAVEGTSRSSPSSPQAGDKRYLLIIIGNTMAGLFLLGVTIGLVCVCCKKRRRFKALRDEEFFTSTLPGHHNLVHFTLAQLQEASGEFKCKLGVGGFGSAYKGTLSNGSIVAIKQLETAIRGDTEFESQVTFLHSLNHPNVVRLSGFCASGSRRLLISEYMSHGSLDAWIFNKSITKLEHKTSLSSSSTHASSLDWKTRFSIALDVAKGLAFLHENNLIHLAIKPQNILLDDKFVAKLSDYGLSRLMDQEDGCLIMHMRGTAAYMAPEWLQHACATEKSDVYSYGMVLMEMLGGRKNVDLSKERESWFFPILAAKMYKEGKVLEVLDENLTRSTSIMGGDECEQAKRVMQIAFWCILESPTRRPDMGSILSMLQGHQEVPEPPLPMSFGGLNLHTSMSSLDDNHHFHHDYYDRSGASSPSCFNISFVSEPSSAMAAFDSWSSSGKGQLDDCSLLLPSPTSALFVE